MNASKNAATPQTPTPVDARLFVGAVVRHRHRSTGFGVAQTAGRIKGFIEPSPGWHRALVDWRDGTEQYVDTDRLEVDATDTTVEEAGVQMSLFGDAEVPHGA